MFGRSHEETPDHNTNDALRVVFGRTNDDVLAELSSRTNCSKSVVFNTALGSYTLGLLANVADVRMIGRGPDQTSFEDIKLLTNNFVQEPETDHSTFKATIIELDQSARLDLYIAVQYLEEDEQPAVSAEPRDLDFRAARTTVVSRTMSQLKTREFYERIHSWTFGLELIDTGESSREQLPSIDEAIWERGDRQCSD